MDQQFYDFRPVLLIGRCRQVELHCADDAAATTCHDQTTSSGADLGQNFSSPERARILEREWHDEAYPRTRMYDGVQDVGKHFNFGVGESSTGGVGQPIFNSDFIQ